MLTKRSDESNLMTKAEIISKTLREMGPFPLEKPPFSEEPDDEEIVVAELEERLPTIWTTSRPARTSGT